MIGTRLRQAWHEAVRLAYRGQRWANDHLPPGMRLLVGILLILGGFLAFLPIFGLWMLPLGVLIAALDVLPMARWLRAWLDRSTRRLRAKR